MSIPNRSLVRVTAVDTEWYGYIGKVIGVVDFYHPSIDHGVEVFAVEFAPNVKFGFEEHQLEVVDVTPRNHL